MFYLFAIISMKNNLSHNEQLEMARKQIERSEDTINEIGVKQFDEQRFSLQKNRNTFKKNEQLANIFEEIENFLDTQKEKDIDRKELKSILKSYLASFDNDIPEIKTDIEEFYSTIQDVLIKRFRIKRNTEWWLFFVLKDTETNEEKKELFSSLKNPELTYLFYLLAIEKTLSIKK